MSNRHLKLNTSRTKFMMLLSKHVLLTYSSPSQETATFFCQVLRTALNSLSFSILIQFISTSYWLYLQNKTKSQFISTATFLIQASISHLDDQNSLLTGCPASLLPSPQSVLHSKVTLITCKSDQVTLLLKTSFESMSCFYLSWCRLPLCLDFLLTFSLSMLDLHWPLCRS